MNVLINLLKSLGIVLLAYLLIVVGTREVESIALHFFPMSPKPGSIIGTVGGPVMDNILSYSNFAIHIVFTFGALYLPRKGRICVAIGAFCFILGSLISYFVSLTHG
jgi:hypothetical protein